MCTVWKPQATLLVEHALFPNSVIVYHCSDMVTGIADYIDDDDDNDGLPDKVDNDANGDGIPDHVEIGMARKTSFC